MLSRLPKELTFLREPRPPHHLLGDPRGEEGREPAGRDPRDPHVVLKDRFSVSSDSSPEAARWRMELCVSCRNATAKAATKRQLLPVAVRDTIRCTTC